MGGANCLRQNGQVKNGPETNRKRKIKIKKKQEKLETILATLHKFSRIFRVSKFVNGFSLAPIFT